MNKQVRMRVKYQGEMIVDETMDVDKFLRDNPGVAEFIDQFSNVGFYRLELHCEDNAVLVEDPQYQVVPLDYETPVVIIRDNLIEEIYGMPDYFKIDYDDMVFCPVCDEELDEQSYCVHCDLSTEDTEALVDALRKAYP